MRIHELLFSFRLGFEGVKDSCVNVLSSQLTAHNSLRILSHADWANADDLAAKARPWCLWYLCEPAHLTQANLCCMSSTALAGLMSDDTANVEKEKDLFEVVKAWVEARGGKCVPDSDVIKLLSCIR